MIVYTGISRNEYHGRDLLQLIAKGLPVGAYATTWAEVAEYHWKNVYPDDGLIIAFDIPNVMDYVKVTDKYYTNGGYQYSFKLIKKPPRQTFVAIGATVGDFRGYLK